MGNVGQENLPLSISLPFSTQSAQERRTGAQQKAKIIPVAASDYVVKRELLPTAKDVDKKDDPSRQPIPKSP
jgi:hypothetical protein